ncbi:MAG: EscU/YscU/HrcU family type III secretion system export apparatus switch protein [Deferribacteres bacterium]|nr:EscU/YscU/HrcU family type III secretion system export apparatus switch protein [candidate division KSB1 bacterium]MCB9501951.1 EscU/YscU/HrcU family type III secretion system export apparatus switch protein [Deferribacteres bacterium]
MQKTAVALSYKPSKSSAPQVVAKGKGLLAEKIIAIAQENGVEVLRDDKLLQALMLLEVEQQIPVELYDAVAAVLAFIYKKRAELPAV